MTEMLRLNVGVLFMTTLVYSVSAQSNVTTYMDKVANYVTLLELYEYENHSVVDVVPIVDASMPMHVWADVDLYSLSEFDEVEGHIEMAMSVTLSWRDEIVQAITNLPNNAVFIINNVDDSLVVPPDAIWTPTVGVRNSIREESAQVGGEEFLCRYTLFSGVVMWRPEVLVRTVCTPDVTYYPFDRQTCIFSLAIWGYTAQEVMFIPNSPVWGTDTVTENSAWRIVTTETTDEVRNDQSLLRLSLTIERKPLFFAFNIILPIIALSLLTLMVFWLPADSGERVGYAVTCFLSFVVLLNTVMDILPRTSAPMSYLIYFVVIMLVFSGLVTTLTIVQVKLLYKVGNRAVPGWLRKTVLAFKCCRRKNKVSITDVGAKRRAAAGPLTSLQNGNTATTSVEEGCDVPEASAYQDPEGIKPEPEVDDVPEVTWSDVGRFIDMVLFLGFLGAQAFFSVTFLLPVAYGS